MKRWYQKPNYLLSKYVRTVLILEGFSQPDSGKQPLFTNGMSALICRTEKDKTGSENSVQLTLFGKSVPSDCWVVNHNTTIIAYLFKSFALAGIFNVSAAKLIENPVDLCNWTPHKINALRTQLFYALSAQQKLEVLDNMLIHQMRENKKECEIIQYATDQIMCNPIPRVLSRILKELKLNERTFQRIFKKYVGITSSQYRRICQFQLSFVQLKDKKLAR